MTCITAVVAAVTAGAQDMSGSSGASTSLASASHEGVVVLHLCRPKSVMRFAETPDLFVDGKVVAELKNGSQHRLQLSQGAKLKVVLPKNFFMQRFSDELIFEGVAEKTGAVYLVLSTSSELDAEAGVNALFFGAITASVTQAVKNAGTKNWHVKPLESDAFESACQK